MWLFSFIWKISYLTFSGVSSSMDHTIQFNCFIFVHLPKFNFFSNQLLFLLKVESKLNAKIKKIINSSFMGNHFFQFISFEYTSLCNYQHDTPKSKVRCQDNHLKFLCSLTTSFGFACLKKPKPFASRRTGFDFISNEILLRRRQSEKSNSNKT